MSKPRRSIGDVVDSVGYGRVTITGCVNGGAWELTNEAGEIRYGWDDDLDMTQEEWDELRSLLVRIRAPEKRSVEK